MKHNLFDVGDIIKSNILNNLYYVLKIDDKLDLMDCYQYSVNGHGGFTRKKMSISCHIFEKAIKYKSIRLIKSKKC